MSLDGGNTPGRLAVAAEPPPYTVLDGDELSAEIDAYELTAEFVETYRAGLRDLRNPSLAQFYVETPRSRVSNADVAARYGAIEAAALELGIEPVSTEEFISLFLPDGAAEKFIENLGRMGINLTLLDDVIRLSSSELAFRNATTTTLVGEQVSAGRLTLQDAVENLLNEMGIPLGVTETVHFVDDFTENNAFDTDRKAHERLFTTFAQYVDLAVKLQ